MRYLYRVEVDDWRHVHGFPNAIKYQFQDAVNYASTVGAQILWMDETKRRFAVDADSHGRLKVFL